MNTATVCARGGGVETAGPADGAADVLARASTRRPDRLLSSVSQLHPILPGVRGGRAEPSVGGSSRSGAPACRRRLLQLVDDLGGRSWTRGRPDARLRVRDVGAVGARPAGTSTRCCRRPAELGLEVREVRGDRADVPPGQVGRAGPVDLVQAAQQHQHVVDGAPSTARRTAASRSGVEGMPASLEDRNVPAPRGRRTGGCPGLPDSDEHPSPRPRSRAAPAGAG